MKKILIIICLAITLCGCAKENTQNPKDTSTQTIEKILAEDDYVVVDVRTKEEFDTSHVVGSLNIPYDSIDENVELDKERTILVYCQSGRRSAIAAKTLKNLGYDVYDLGAYDSITLEKN